MKIALVIESFQPASGGSERSTEQIARGLVRRGHAVTVLTNRACSEAKNLEGIALRVADRLSTKSAVGLLGFNAWVQSQLKHGAFDVSLSVSSSVAADVIQPRNGTAKESFDRRVAIRSNGLGRLLKRIELWLNLKRQTILAAEGIIFRSNSVKRIIPISGYVADQLRRHYGVDPDRMQTIFNCAEVEPLDEEMKGIYRRKIRGELGIGDDAVVYLFAAMDPKLKGLGSLLRAMAELRSRRSDVHLVVAGTVSRRFQKLATQLGIRDAVRWVGKVQEMERYYAAASVTVLPTWSDSSSRVVLESLLHGTPAISTLFDGSAQWIYSPDGTHPVPCPYQPGVAEVVQNGHSAGRVLRSPQNVEALVKAMDELSEASVQNDCAAYTANIQVQINFESHLDQLEQVLYEAAGIPPAAVETPAAEPVQAGSTSIA